MFELIHPLLIKPWAKDLCALMLVPKGRRLMAERCARLDFGVNRFSIRVKSSP